MSIEALRRRYRIAVRWIAFPLHPETPEAGLTLEELFAGRGVDVAAVRRELQRAAADYGLPWGERRRTFNSRRAQELGKWAEAAGRGDAFHDAVFRAYFADGRNLADLEVLADLAAAVGLDPDEARRVLADGRFREAVDRDWVLSRESGVRAVPTFRAGGRRVVGAQPAPVLERLVRAAGAEPRPERQRGV